VRVAYAVSLIFLTVSACFFLVKIWKERGLSFYLRNAMICSVTGMLACIVTSYSQNETLSLICYGVYFSSLMWLLTFFMQFVMAYTDNRGRAFTALSAVLAVIVSANCILNIRYRHVFDVKELIWVTDKNRYLILTPKFWYLVVLGAALFLVVVCVIILIVKTIETPSAYRPRYLVILFMIATTISLNMAFLVFNLPMDWSALFYCAFTIVAWFFSTRYIKTFLLSRTLAVIVDYMDTGLVIFDNVDRVVYLNDRAQSLLEADMEGILHLLEKWYKTQKASTLENSEREISFERRGEKYIFHVQFEAIKDAAGLYNGGFFAVRDITNEKEKQRVSKYNKEHDRLTNLLNQEAFLEACRKTLEDDPTGQYVMIRSEFSAFEAIRAIYGKDTRDAVIAGVGGVIKKKCYGRSVGGWMDDDSFSVLMPVEEFTEKEMVTEIGETINAILGDNARTIRIHAGICAVNDRGNSPKILAEQARVALDYLKEEEGAIVSWYTEGMRQKGIAESNLPGVMAQALSNGELKIYLQPILNGEDKLIGAEALVRWYRNGKVLLPGEFLPQLEKNELIAAVDRFVWQQAVKQLKEWKDEGRNRLFITVNIARKDLYLMDICSEIIKLLKEYDVNPSLLHVDISSETLFREKFHLASIVRTLKEAGIHVNLDNFGGLYSAPVFLKNVSFDGIKICRELIQGLESNPAGKSLTKSIIAMGQNLGIDVYAEGVETEREHRSLKAMECSGYQGFFISEPLPVEEFRHSFFVRKD